MTIADILGDVDPIKAARSGRALGDELTIHYGLLPRANRGIFAINELPDLAGKIQVGLFNIMQEGDIQIKGYPVRMPLDVLLVFTANPEDYTARGKIITPLKDRIGSEIRTHYPATVEEGMSITAQEAWVARDGGRTAVDIPDYLREVVEQIAFLAREDKRDRQALGRQPAPADRVPGKRGQQRGAARRAQSRSARLGAHRGCVRRASGHHRKNGTRIRRRIARRGKYRARADSRRGGQSFHAITWRARISSRSCSGLNWAAN